MIAPLRIVAQVVLVVVCCASACGADAAAEGTNRRKEFLEREIARHNKLYFEKAQPEISDAEFDRLKIELRSLREQLPDDRGPASTPAELNGDERIAGFSKCAHHSPMLSLDKAYSEAEVEAFSTRVANVLRDRNVRYVVEPKFDGLAVSAIYENGRLVRVVTRGNGSEGDDVTENARRFSNIPRELRGGPDFPKFLDARGEVFMSKAEFARLNEEREDAEEVPYASPRNLASGTLKSTSGVEAKGRRLAVVFYALGTIEPVVSGPPSQIMLCHQFERWGLPTISPVRTSVSGPAVWKAVQDIGRQRDTLPYPIDGVVIKVDSFEQRGPLGANEHAPNWAIAYKFTAERRTTRLRAITIQVGRTGGLTPVAELDPVELGGTQITRATLHNAEEIARRDLRIGDTVVVERSGDVIPAVTERILSARPLDSVPFAFPDLCPSCDSLVTRRDGEVIRRCTNRSCPSQVQRRLAHFVSPRGLGIVGLGDATIAALVRNGAVREPVDFFRLKREDLMAIPAMGEKRCGNLLKAIADSRHTDLKHQLVALGIPGLGAGVAGKLAHSFQNFREVGEAGEKELVSTGRVTAETAKQMVAFFQRPSSQELILELSATAVETR
jgi:DNA ligase (NAD+)